MKIHIGADHAGFELKEKLKTFLSGLGHVVADAGAASFDADDDYPDFILPLAQAVAAEAGSFGVVIGGSGQGEAMAANRVPGVRAAVFYGPRIPVAAVDALGSTSVDPFEIVRLEREHNDANVLSIGARFVTDEDATEALEIFLSTPFSGDERHLRRIAKF